MKVPRIDTKATAENIRRLRKAEGYSLKEFKDFFGFTTEQMCFRWEHEKGIPSVDNLVIMAYVFGVSIEDIIVLK